MNRTATPMMACACLALASVVWIATSQFASVANARANQQDPTSVAKPLLPFVDGKIVTVVTDSTDDGGMYLEDVELRQLGSEWFLTGKFARFGRSDEIDGLKRAWIPMSKVQQLYEYESKEALNFSDETKA